MEKREGIRKMRGMRRLVYLAVAAVLLLGACGGKQKGKREHKPEEQLPYDSLLVPYEDDILSILLPQGWKLEKDTVDVDFLKGVVDSLNIRTGVIEFLSPRRDSKIRIVKGASRWMMPNNPVRDFADMSRMRASMDSACIYMSEVTDSLLIDGNEACRVWFAYVYDGDTVIQNQFAVLKGKYGLYYVNGIYDYSDKKSARLFLKILDTLRLKDTE